MPSLTLYRKFDAATLTALALAATFALAACGGGDGASGDVTGPPPGDDPGNDPPPSGPADGPAPVGDVIYALDNGNNLLMFGSQSGESISRQVGITGLPILKRMIGIDFRASNGKLYGVGNDSRVYTIDTLTGAATAVGAPFSPAIISSFDIHFGMDFDPKTDRIRLISSELGGNWSINPDDGTAIAGNAPRYAAGDPHEGEVAHIAGLTHIPASQLPAAFRMSLSLSSSGPCEDLAMAIDPALGQLITSCDAGGIDWAGFADVPGIESLACVELDYSGPGGGIWAAGQRINGALNSLGTVDPATGAIDWKVNVPDNYLIQSITFKPKDPLAGQRVRSTRPSLSARSAAGPVTDAAGVDPVAMCRGGGAS
jgi:Domain of unknown function (DUF4394)